jgi:predicted ABC-type ATPase
MIVVAGPSGSGKFIRFNLADFGVDLFNVDDRCREIHGSAQGIPSAVRAQAQKECEEFVRTHIASQTSFATESTLRSTVALEQAKYAGKAGFRTSIIFVGTEDVGINLERVRRRGLAGGHSAPPQRIRDIYAKSLSNLPEALKTFSRGEVWDNSGQEPRLVFRVREGRVTLTHPPVPEWVRLARDGSDLAAQLDSAS